MISQLFIEGKIDKLAHQAATSPNNKLPEPSLEAKKAGNYIKGHLKFKGMDITIENPQDSIRSGTDVDGTKWKRKLSCHYGYIKGTIGKDKDHLDCFIGPNHSSNKVFIVNQNRTDNVKDFDEHKLMLGFDKHYDAVKEYLKNYDSDWEKKGGVGSVYGTDIIGLKHWIKTGNTKKPFTGEKYDK